MEERKKRFSFPSFELKKTSGLISLASPKKRMSTDFTTPPPKKPRQGSPLVNQKSFTAERGGSAPNTSTSMDSAAPYTPPSRNRGQYASPFPSPLGNISSDVFGSPDSQSSPRLVFKTKVCYQSGEGGTFRLFFYYFFLYKEIIVVGFNVNEMF